MTKIYEEALFLTVSEAVLYFREKEPKGEFVIVVEGSKEIFGKTCEADIERFFLEQLKSGKTKTQAAKETALKFGLKRNEVYNKYKEE